MTDQISDERLAEFAKDDDMPCDVTHSEIISMTAELLALRALLKADEPSEEEVKAAAAALAETVRAYLSAPKPVAGWRDIATAPKDGTPVKLLTETEAVYDEHNPALLMGGWRRVAENDHVVGWLPVAPKQEG